MSPKKNRVEIITDEQVAVRAYERWMGRGCPASDGLEDWIEARRELESERRKPQPKTAMPAKAPPKTKPSSTPASIH